MVAASFSASAIRFAIQNGADCITILGGTGSRIDHMLGNVCLLGIGLEENIDIFLLDKKIHKSLCVLVFRLFFL